MKEQTSVLPLFWVVYIPLIRAAQGKSSVGINRRCRNARAVHTKLSPAFHVSAVSYSFWSHRAEPPPSPTELSLPFNDALLANRPSLKWADKVFFLKKKISFFYLLDSAFLTFHGVSSLSPLSTHEGSLQALLPGCRDDGVLSAEGPRH